MGKELGLMDGFDSSLYCGFELAGYFLIDRQLVL
jgi:hypothetical protein